MREFYQIPLSINLYLREATLELGAELSTKNMLMLAKILPIIIPEEYFRRLEIIKLLNIKIASLESE